MTESSSRCRPRGIATALPAVMLALALSACGTDSAAPTTSLSSTTVATPTSAVVNDAECQQTPPNGQIDRTGMNLRFASGDIRIAVARTPTTPTTTPPPVPAPAPITPTSVAPPSNSVSSTSTPPPSASTPATPATQCFKFGRWGSADPAVPPDSLLFIFKGSASDGAQIAFFIGDLTGGGPPPAVGTKRIVPPLVAPINAQIGASVDGKHFQATQCSLKITAMAATRASGYFQCPTATSTDANPFAPSDDVSYDDDPTSTAPPTPGAPAPVTPAPTTTRAPETATLSGWFSVGP